MTFRNEYIPPIAQETSEFLKSARGVLRTGNNTFDKWTVNRELDMALVKQASGHDVSSANQTVWAFIDRKGYYVFGTERVSQEEVSAEEIAITYKLNAFWEGDGYSRPDASSLASIKEALREYKDWGVVSDYKRCRITLIDAATGKEI